MTIDRSYFWYSIPLLISFTHRSVNIQFKNTLCEKAKADTRMPNQGRGATFIITEMAVFTLEKDYSCETGYPFDDSRQIGNMSQSENGIVLILNEQSA